MIRRFILSLLLGISIATPASADASLLSVDVTGMAPSAVPKGAQRVTFLSVELRASCDDDVSVRTLTVQHRGLGDASDIERVYLMDGNARLSRGTAFGNSKRTAVVRLTKPLLVEACERRTLNVAVDVSNDAESTGQHVLSLLSVASNVSSVDIVHAKGRGVSVAETKPTQIGTVDIEFLDLLQPLRYGASRTLARFRLETDGEANQEIHAITFTNDGKATDADLKNLRIQNRTGDVLTNVLSSMDGDRVVLTFDPPFRLDRNDEVLLELKGDIRASNRRTVRFVLEEPSDLEAAPRTR